MRTGRITGEKGVVMMETILVLPFYLVLLACLFTLGEFCMARLGLCSGENLRLWENGTRHGITLLPERTVFWFLPGSSNGVVTGGSGFRFTRSSGLGLGTWGQNVAGRAVLNVQPSVWSFAIRSTVENMYPTSGQAATQSAEEMVSQGTLENPLESHLLSRQAYAGREGIYLPGSDNGNLWQTEYLSTWNLGVAGTISPVAQGAYARVDRYGSRNDNYVTWSE